jgi:ubiquinone/menaquinone biosynthesis C-methylase UbiE
MSMQPYPVQGNTYINDTESGAEMARLHDQDLLITRAMGGLFPERDDLDGISQVLDIGCGPGRWVQEVGFAHQDIKVVGIDISNAMIEYARAQARVQGLENATFRVMDATRPLDFPDASFDLVNARTIAGFMLREDWPKLIDECLRILRPGGIIRLTETDLWGTTNSLAFETLSGWCMLALKKSEHGFSPDGRTFGITPVLGRLLRDAGFQGIQHRSYTNDFSSGTEVHFGMYKNFLVFFKLVQPFLAKMAVATLEEAEPLYQQVMLDILTEDFCGIMYLLTVWGHKPLS